MKVYVYFATEVPDEWTDGEAADWVDAQLGLTAIGPVDMKVKPERDPWPEPIGETAMGRTKQRRPLMAPRAASRLSRKIARALFTDGFGERAERLVLTVDGSGSKAGRDLGGWSERAVADRIARLLRETKR